MRSMALANEGNEETADIPYERVKQFTRSLISPGVGNIAGTRVTTCFILKVFAIVAAESRSIAHIA